MVRAFNPLPANHPLVTDGMKCPACQKAFVQGDITCLIPLGPGDDEEAQERARAGRPYNAIAVPVHYACATGEGG